MIIMNILHSYLLIEHLIFAVDNNRWINEVLHPVWPAFHVQRQIPVRPTCDPMLEVLICKINFLKFSRKGNNLGNVITHCPPTLQNKVWKPRFELVFLQCERASSRNWQENLPKGPIKTSNTYFQGRILLKIKFESQPCLVWWSKHGLC